MFNKSGKVLSNFTVKDFAAWKIKFSQAANMCHVVGHRSNFLYGKN